MSDKQQHTAFSLRNTMMNHYGDEIHHKHDKRHLPSRQHCRSHPHHTEAVENVIQEINHRTGLLRETNLRKYRKQIAKRMIH